MKYLHFFALFAILFTMMNTMPLYAQQDASSAAGAPPPPRVLQPFAVGAAAEVNGNAIDTLKPVFSAMLHFEWSLPKVPLALGFKGTYSYDTSPVHFVEASALFRWYAFSDERKIASTFFQAEGGPVFAILPKSETRKFAVTGQGGLTFGVRIRITNNFYIEPYARAGYPFRYGAGIAFGAMLGAKDTAINGYNVNTAEEAFATYAYSDDELDAYGLSEYVATEESIQNLIEHILELEAYPDANQDELIAANNLLDSLLAQMEAGAAEYAEDEAYYDENYFWDDEAGIGYWYDAETGE